jgi:hypothetical protein
MRKPSSCSKREAHPFLKQFPQGKQRSLGKHKKEGKFTFVKISNLIIFFSVLRIWSSKTSKNLIIIGVISARHW